MRAAFGAEWIKLWTTRTVWWALAAGAVLMAAAAGQYAIYAGNGDLPPDLLRAGKIPAGTVAVLAVDLAQLAFVALAMLVVTSEYSTGTIRATLAWTPSRGRLLLAKCAVVAAVTFAAGTATGLLGALVAVPVLGSAGTAGPGMVADALAIGAYLTLLALLATGLAAALRGPVVTLVVVLLLVAVLPPMLRLPDVGVLNAIADALPGVAGQDFLRGDGLGLVVLAAWAAGSVLVGWRVLCHRDA